MNISRALITILWGLSIICSYRLGRVIETQLANEYLNERWKRLLGSLMDSVSKAENDELNESEFVIEISDKLKDFHSGKL